MIFVDGLKSWGAPWQGGVSCHMTSDESERELLDFAAGIHLPLVWYQGGSHFHFDLSSRWRRKAIAAGALEVDRRGYVEAVRRWRSRQSSSGGA